MTPVRPGSAGVSAARHRVTCGAEAGPPTRPATVPAQRSTRQAVLPPVPPASWEGYSNAGPDVYWSPDERVSLS